MRRALSIMMTWRDFWALIGIGVVVGVILALAAGVLFAADLAPGESATIVCRPCPTVTETCAGYILDLEQCAFVRDGCLSTPLPECETCPPAEMHDAAWRCLRCDGDAALVTGGAGDSDLRLHPGLDHPGHQGRRPPKGVKKAAWIVGAVILGAVIYAHGQRHGDRDDVTNVFIEGDCHGRCD